MRSIIDISIHAGSVKLLLKPVQEVLLKIFESLEYGARVLVCLLPGSKNNSIANCFRIHHHLKISKHRTVGVTRYISSGVEDTVCGTNTNSQPKC